MIGDAGDVAGTLQLVRQLDPDVLLLDVGMTHVGRSDVLRALAAVARLPRTICSRTASRRELITVLRLGVRGVDPSRSHDKAPLRRHPARFFANRCARRTDQVRDTKVRAMVGSADAAITSRNLFRLTRRQLDIVAAVAIGETNKGSRAALFHQRGDRRRHLSSIFDTSLGVAAGAGDLCAQPRSLIDHDAS